jgi:hypothetical protein
MAKIYLSSTSRDLIEYRKEVLRALELMRQEVIAMEGYSAESERPLQKCLSDVEKCDFYVGIFAFRYGFIPAEDNPDGLSITELEYRHAKRNDKQCFIFLVDEEINWPIRHIEMEEEILKKLKALREELKREYLIAWFKDEKDLADKVSQAIFNKLQPASEPKLKKLFPFHSKLCNRRRQVNQFRNFFNDNLEKRPGLPQIYFIHGEDGQCHNSLVERLIRTHIKNAALAQWGQQESIVISKYIEWVDEGSVDERLRDLKMMLFEEFSPAYKMHDLSATALSQLPMALPYRIITLSHSISASHLDESAWKLIDQYTSYWANNEVNTARPQFIIFLSVVYPKPQPSVWYKPWTMSKRFDKESAKSRLQEISARINAHLPCFLLEELPGVGPEEVEQWFSKYGEEGNFSVKIKQESLTRLFESENAEKSMLDIELELLNLVERA